MISLPRSIRYRRIASFVNRPGNNVIVLRVWSFDTAAICTHASGCGTPAGWGLPHGSDTVRPDGSGRHGPTNSIAHHVATRGSFPQPLMRWTTPSRNRIGRAHV